MRALLPSCLMQMPCMIVIVVILQRYWWKRGVVWDDHGHRRTSSQVSGERTVQAVDKEASAVAVLRCLRATRDLP